MDADSSIGAAPSHRHRSLPQVRVDPEYYSGRPAPSIRRHKLRVGRSASPESDYSTPAVSNLAASFPLFFFGAGCVAVALFVILERSASAIGRIPLWVPFVALGIIALAGGTLSVFAEPDEPPKPNAAGQVPPDPSPARARYVPSEPDERPRGSSRVEAHRSVPRTRAVQPPASPRAVAPPTVGATQIAEPVLSAYPEKPGAADLPSDAMSLLKEIDLIEADLQGARSTRGLTSSERQTGPPTPPTAPKVPAGPQVSAATGIPPLQTDYPGPNRMESEVPRQVAHCVGCGSAILHVGTPSQCQVCGEPLCSECQHRSLVEGKPNLCPLCALLDTVHSKGPAASRTARPRV
jgi:hypothetical protein